MWEYNLVMESISIVIIIVFNVGRPNGSLKKGKLVVPFYRSCLRRANGKNFFLQLNYLDSASLCKTQSFSSQFRRHLFFKKCKGKEIEAAKR